MKHSASPEVKQRLAEFVLNKKQREANQQKSQSTIQQQQQQPQQQSPSSITQHQQHHHHQQQQQPQNVSRLISNAIGSMCNSITGTINNGQPPDSCKINNNQFVNLAWNPVPGKYEDNLSTLRKTASEPNLKVRSSLKKKTIANRSSPLLKRKLPKIRGRNGPSSIGSASLAHQHSLYGSITEGSASAPVSASSSMIQENSPPTSPYGSSSIKPLDQDNAGKLLTHSSHLDDCHLTNFASGNHLDRGGGGGGVRGASGNGNHPLHSLSHHHIKGAILSHSHVHPHPHPATTHHVASIDGSIGHSAIIRKNHLPLARALSAPLPLGHPQLHSSSSSPVSPLTTCTSSSSASDQLQSSTPLSQHQRNKVKQHIRQTVLTRTSSKQQLQSQSFEEETEAAIAQDDMVDSPSGTMGLSSVTSGLGTISSAASTPPLGGSVSNLPGGIPSRKERIKRQYSQEAPPTPEEGTSSCSISGIESSYSIDYLASASGSGSVGSASSGCKSREATPTEIGGRVTSGRGENSSGEPILMKQQLSRERDPFLAQKDLMSPQLMAMNDLRNPEFQQLIYSVQQSLRLITEQQQQQQQQQQQHQPSPLNHQSSPPSSVHPLHTSNSSVITTNPRHPHGHSHPPPPPPQPPSTASHHHHFPHYTISLLPEGNQYPQILPHSRYPYYDSTRPLSRASSSPFVALKSSGSLEKSSSLSPPINFRKSTTGLAYDNLMLKHQCDCGDNSSHPEHSGRLQSIWARLQETGLAARCEKIRSRKATLEEVQTCHSEAYTLLFATSPSNRPKIDPTVLDELPIKSFVMLPCGGIGVDSDTTWNQLHTPSAALMAVGCVSELALKVAQGELKNGFAIVRPPGHHAEVNQAMGFCFFNSLAIAAQAIRKKHNMETILIVDWDVHHGNGIQQIFFDSSHVLYISLHRHDDGNFFPGTGDPTEVGVEDGTGYNVNIAWSGGISPETKGDAEYLAAFRSIVMPIAKNFNPEIVLVACGFDAAAGHPPPLGGYQVSPACFAWMTKQLMKLANGKLVLSLEGGYDLPSICDCAQECVMALLGDETTPISEHELSRQPSQQAIYTLKKVISIQAAHWPVVKHYAHLIECSHLEAQDKDNEEFGAASALPSLTMKHLNSQPSNEEPMDQDIDK